MFSELKELFESDLNSIAGELFAVCLLTSHVAESPSYAAIIKTFHNGFSFLKTIEQVTERCRKFFGAMYKVGGDFSLAADSIKEQLNVFVSQKFNVTLDI